jgi:hypothetical protein
VNGDTIWIALRNLDEVSFGCGLFQILALNWVYLRIWIRFTPSFGFGLLISLQLRLNVSIPLKKHRMNLNTSKS